jgi:hypothetical protein
MEKAHSSNFSWVAFGCPSLVPEHNQNLEFRAYLCELVTARKSTGCVKLDRLLSIVPCNLRLAMVSAPNSIDASKFPPVDIVILSNYFSARSAKSCRFPFSEPCVLQLSRRYRFGLRLCLKLKGKPAQLVSDF